MSLNNGNGHREIDDLDTLTFVAYPGAGKGTAVNYLQKEMKNRKTPTSYFEVGTIVRSHVKANTEFGQAAVAFSKQGKLVPDEIIVPPIRESIAMLDPETKWFVDGFPRNPNQIQAYEEAMSAHERKDIILHLSLSDDPVIAREIMEQRMRKRAEEALVRGEKPRADDIDPAARAKRFDEAKKLDDVIAHFEAKDKVLTIDATKSIPEVEAQIFHRVSNLFKGHVIA